MKPTDPSTPPAAAETLWYYADPQNQPVGPIPLAELRRLAHNGTISAVTLVHEEGGSGWLPFSSMEGVALPPPLPVESGTPSKRPRRWVTIVALLLFYPVGVILLALNKGFSRRAKIALAILFLPSLVALVASLNHRNGSTPPPDVSRISTPAKERKHLPETEKVRAPTPSSSHTQPFLATLDANVVREGNLLLVNGNTNLPEGTRLLLTLKMDLAGESVRWGETISVGGGKLRSQPLTFKNGPLPSGEYQLMAVYVRLKQLPEVQAVVGKDGVNLSGPLVKETGASGKTVRLEKAVSIAGPENTERRSRLTADYTAQRKELVGLLRELDSFKTTPLFLERGFGRGGHGDWLERAKAASERNPDSFSNYGRAAAFLVDLGGAYQRNKGQENEETRGKRKELADSLGDPSLVAAARSKSDFGTVFDGSFATEVGNADVQNLGEMIAGIYEGKATVQDAKDCVFLFDAIRGGFSSVVGDYLIYSVPASRGRNFEFALARNRELEQAQKKNYSAIEDFYDELRGSTFDSRDPLFQGAVVLERMEEFSTAGGLVKRVPLVKVIQFAR